MKLPKTKIPEIDPGEKSPLVSQLLGIIEQQSAILQILVEEVQLLRDEIARLKNQKPKPKIPPSKLEKDPVGKKEKKTKSKRPGSIKRQKTKDLAIHETIAVAPEQIPSGSVFKGYRPYTVQGIELKVHNVRYLLETWKTPKGEYIQGIAVQNTPK